ncbi:Uracil-DNA glycosylase [[Candida] zeylanoides]
MTVKREALECAGGVKKRLITDFFAKKVVSSQANVTKAVALPTANSKRDASNANAPKSGPSTTGDGVFDKDKWVASLTPEQRSLLDLEITTLHPSWLAELYPTLTKPYFLSLKRFLLQEQATKTIFPPNDQIYSWSQHTPLDSIRCLILGQDPYHNFNQAHGLAFSVMEPTRPPPSLVNIYKALKLDFANFETPDYAKLAKSGNPGGGNLTRWAQQGVLMLNTCLTVEAHKANSHANRGWEQFTEEVLRVAMKHHKEKGFVIMGWGTPAQKRVAKVGFKETHFLILRSVHPSPLSAHRGFFEAAVFKKCNEWLRETGREAIDWGVVPGNVVR